MVLSYGKSSPHDILAKAERDLDRLVRSEIAQDDSEVSDALFDLAVSVTSLKDWLKEHSGTSFSSSSVENFVLNSTALSSFRDIANQSKHRTIRKYSPVTDDVTTSAIAITSYDITYPSEDAPHDQPKEPTRRLKIIRADGTRHRAVDLGQEAIREWKVFFQKHDI